MVLLRYRNRFFSLPAEKNCEDSTGIIYKIYRNVSACYASQLGLCAGVGIGDLFGEDKDPSGGYRVACQVVGASICLGSG
jgi:hypothetical protein